MLYIALFLDKFVGFYKPYFYLQGLRRDLYTSFTLVFVFICVAIKLVINILLGHLLIQKRKMRKVDPIQNSITTARQYTPQLNRINLIVLLMSIISFLVNIPQNVNQVLFWDVYFRGNLYLLYAVVITVTRLFSMLLLAMKVFVIGMVSLKIRKEFWLALKCANENTAFKSLGIEIDPQKLRRKGDAHTGSHESLDIQDSSNTGSSSVSAASFSEEIETLNSGDATKKTDTVGS